MSKIYELSVINRIKAEICHGLLSDKYWAADEVIGIIASYVFPMLKMEIIYVDSTTKNQTGSLINAINVLKHFNDDGNHLEKYSRNGLCEYFTKLASTLDNDTKKRIISSITLIRSIEVGGYLSFNGNKNVYETIANNNNYNKDLELQYGTEGYTEDIVQEDLMTEVIAPEVMAPEVIVQTETEEPDATNNINTNKESALNKLDSIIEKIENAEGFNDKFPYIWKLGISSTQFNELKESLKQVFSGVTGRKLTEYINKYSLALVIYSAEWYRRCYEGNNGSDNNLWQDISIITNRNVEQLLWETKLLTSYKADLCFEYNNTQWQRSLFLLGGFPIKYKSIQLEAFYEEVFNMIEDGTTELICDQTFNSKTVTHSIQDESGSLHLLLKEIINGSSTNQFPFSQDDINNDRDLKKFLRRIVEGYRRSRTKKFVLNWIILEDDENPNLLKRCLRLTLKPERNGKFHKYLSETRLNDWGIRGLSEIPVFWLSIGFNDDCEFARVLRFENRFNGDFVAIISNSQNFVNIHNIPATHFDKIKLRIEYESKDLLTSEINSKYFSFPQYNEYMVLYPTNVNYGEWTTAENSGARFAVLFNEDVKLLNISGEDQNLYKRFNNDTNATIYGFVVSSDNIKLKLPDNKKVDLQCNKGEKFVITNKPYSNTNVVEYKESKVLYKFINDESQFDEIYVPILWSKKSIEIMKLDKTIVKEKINVDNVELFFKQDEFNFTKWTNDNKPHQGFLRLKAVIGDMQSNIFDCYYLTCESKFIQRDLEMGTVKFAPQIKGVQCMDDSHQTETTNEWNVFQLFKEHFHGQITTEFHIGSNNEYIILNIYNPFKFKLLYQNNNILFWKEDGCFDVQLIFKDMIQVKLLNTEGVTTDRNDYLSYLYFNKNDWELNHLKNDSTQNIRTIGCINFNIANKWDGDNSICVSTKKVEHYDFYYWSCNIDEDPIKISTTITEIDDKKSKITFHDYDLDRKGIIFQSLINGVAPRYRVWRENIAHITDKDTKSLQFRIKCFEVAKQHHIYFHLFKPLLNIINFEDDREWFMAESFIDLFFNYIETHYQEMDKSDYEAFHRMAEEFKFDWLLLPQCIWMRYLKKDKTGMRRKFLERLFLSNPAIMTKKASEIIAYKRLVKCYTYLPDENGVLNIVTTPHHRIPNMVKAFYSSIRMAYMPIPGVRGRRFEYNNDYRFTSRFGNVEKQKELLTFLYTDDNAFNQIWRYTYDNMLTNN